MSSVHTLYYALTLPLMHVKCFVVDEIIFFEPKAKKHLPFFSYTAKHRKQHFPFFRSSPFCTRRSSSLMPWWWLSYICLDECLWMQMLWCNVMCEWMSKHISEAILSAIIFLETITHQLCIPLGTTLELLRLLLSAESALTFRCKLCIPLGTTLELLRFLLFGTRWCVLSFYIYIPWGILLL